MSDPAISVGMNGIPELLNVMNFIWIDLIAD